MLLDVDPLPPRRDDALGPRTRDELRLCSTIPRSASGLLASDPGERSFESAQLRHGIWRHHLIEAFTGKMRSGVAKDGTLTAAALHAFLADAVPRTLRRSYETPQEQTPVALGESERGDGRRGPGQVLGPGGELLDPTRMKRVAFRSESAGKMKDLAGYRKSHTLPERANDWARKYVNRIAAADIKADLDNTFDMVRDSSATSGRTWTCPPSATGWASSARPTSSTP